MAELEQVLFTRLTGYSALAALVSTRVYPVEAPQNPTTPYITFQRIDEDVVRGMTEDHGMTAPTIQIDCWGLTYPSVRSVAAQVRAALKRWSDAATSPVVLDSFLRRMQDRARDQDDPEDQRFYRTSMDFEIWIRE